MAGGDNAIVVVPGAGFRWDQWPDDAGHALLATAPVVLAQLEIPLPVVQAAAMATHGRFVLNASPATELDDVLLTACAVLIVNEHELAVTSPTRDIASARAALRRRGVAIVITTLGERGALVTDADGTWSTPSPAADVVDTTGAGDAFAGVLAARLTAGDAVRTAVRWAVAAGSFAVRAAGTTASYADATTLASLLD